MVGDRHQYMGLYVKISKGNLRGWVRGEILSLLPPNFFDRPLSMVQEKRGEVIKESKWRMAALLSLSDGENVFLKRDKTKDWVESVKYLFSPSKGKKEFLIASQLEKKNLNIPKPLGWMERIQKGWIIESYYLSEAIGTGVSFIDEVAKSKNTHSVIELANTVRKFQDAGLFHRDLHGGNFLWEGDSLFLTDLHRAKILKSLSLSQRLWNLSHLFHSLRSKWGEEEYLQFLTDYFEGKIDDSQRRECLLQKIYPVMDRLQKRQWRSRGKRCLKESTEFTVQKERGIRYFHRKDFSIDRLKRAMADHLHRVKETPNSLVKCSPKVNVSILEDGGEKICLKQFCTPTIGKRIKERFRRSKGMKSWMAANSLRARGLPSLKPLALAEKRDWLGVKESFLFMETRVEDQEMDRYILKGFEGLKQKRLFIKVFARWLDRLHKMDLYHRDMKTCNILVSEKGNDWDFHLLDFEDLRVGKKVNEKKLFRNFLQINTSTPKIISNVDRMRFFKEYLRLNPMVKDPKVFLRELVKESRRRGLLYVSPRGVVMEEMG